MSNYAQKTRTAYLKRNIILSGLISLLYCSNIAAETARAALDHFLTDLQTLEAHFTQHVYQIGTPLTTPATGLFQLKRPNQFRWDYQTPEVKQVIADGRDLWLIENDLEQITQHYQSMALKNTPAAILFGTEPLETNFTSVEKGTYQGLQWLELQPKDPESDIKKVTLAFHNNELRRLALQDQLDQVTQFRFTNLQRNPVLANEHFEFNPPDDWDLFQH
jgi:outer membrane lipoprotein carrier protein